MNYMLDHEAFATGPRLGGPLDGRPLREPLDALEVDLKSLRRNFSNLRLVKSTSQLPK
jgi:hypothetical protein